MTYLKILFSAILLVMLWTTIQAGLSENLFHAGPRLFAEPWWIATMWDAYCGFLTFYAWVFYKEPSWGRRIAWFVLVMCLGNIAMSAYVLWQLFRLPADAPVSALLLRREAA